MSYHHCGRIGRTAKSLALAAVLAAAALGLTGHAVHDDGGRPGGGAVVLELGR